MQKKKEPKNIAIKVAIIVISAIILLSLTSTFTSYATKNIDSPSLVSILPLLFLPAILIILIQKIKSKPFKKSK